MMAALVGKLLRDVRLSLLLVALLLAGYQTLWAKITDRISAQLLPMLSEILIPGVTLQDVQQTFFAGPGKIVQSLIGGEDISLFRVKDALTIGYIHPLTQTILCIWAIGRAAGAVAGELDRGTMELLLAQPVPRYRVILAHLCVDCLTIPVLCLSLWAGNWIGAGLIGLHEEGQGPGVQGPAISPMIFAPALLNVAALVFAVSGFTMWLSARGRFRWRVLGVAVFIALLQFLVNLVGQLWDAVAPLRPFTVFYYYQPQQIVLHGRWMVPVGASWNGGQPLFLVPVLAVLFGVGVVGYALALWKFCRRDLPAPL
jgi:ABC-2 type transport system permease protein